MCGPCPKSGSRSFLKVSLGVLPSLISHLYAFGDFSLDATNRVLKKGEKPIALTPKALEILLLLIEHSGQVVCKDELMRTIWPDSFVEESNLTQTVFMLRKALGETAEQRYILTVQGQGYRFVPEVKEISGSVDLAPASWTPSLRIEVPQPERTDRPWVKKRWLITGAVLLVLAAAFTLIFAGQIPAFRRRRCGSESCWLFCPSRT